MEVVILEAEISSIRRLFTFSGAPEEAVLAEILPSVSYDSE